MSSFRFTIAWCLAASLATVLPLFLIHQACIAEILK